MQVQILSPPKSVLCVPHRSHLQGPNQCLVKRICTLTPVISKAFLLIRVNQPRNEIICVKVQNTKQFKKEDRMCSYHQKKFQKFEFFYCAQWKNSNLRNFCWMIRTQPISLLKLFLLYLMSFYGLIEKNYTILIKI